MKTQVGFILLVLFIAGSPSFAYERRHSSFFCFVKTDDKGEMDFDSDSHGVRNRSEGVHWGRRTLMCPVLVDDNLPVSRIQALRVQGWDGDTGGEGTVEAKACVSFRGLGSVSNNCGDRRGSPHPSDRGPFDLLLTRDMLQVWRDFPSAYPYVEVTLPGRGTEFSSLFGYVATD